MECMVFATPRSLYPLRIVPHITVDDEYDFLNSQTGLISTELKHWDAKPSSKIPTTFQNIYFLYRFPSLKSSALNCTAYSRKKKNFTLCFTSLLHII